SIEPRHLVSSEQLRAGMVFVVWIMHARGFHQCIFAPIIFEKFRWIRFAVRDGFLDGFDGQVVVLGDLLGRLWILLAHITAVKDSSTNPRAFEIACMKTWGLVRGTCIASRCS